jgi:hypothetical protein
VGAALDDGRRVVFKAYQKQWGRSFLVAVGRVQRHLAQRGFACPAPLTEAAEAVPALATAESYLPDPGMTNIAGAKVRAVSAQGLADQIDQCRRLSEPDLQRHPLARVGGGLYPKPPSGCSTSRSERRRPLGLTSWHRRLFRYGTATSSLC